MDGGGMQSSTPPATCRASCGTPPSCCATRGRYVFVSSISVYADFSVAPAEGHAVAELGDAPVDELAPTSRTTAR